ASLRCIDLPGYGFARVTAAVRDGFAPMVEDYLLSRATLKLVLVLVDCRREVDDRDQSLLEFLAARKLAALVVGTKADKLGAAARGVWVARASAAAALPRGAVLLTAARTGLGIDGPRSLLDAIVRSCGLTA
ncbi:MAG: hypothetical protein K1X88_32610, partial [Nannocystaceae bacterium]|nr:hypothetical protein [Nannocystaceae bacterium]